MCDVHEFVSESYRPFETRSQRVDEARAVQHQDGRTAGVLDDAHRHVDQRLAARSHQATVTLRVAQRSDARAHADRVEHVQRIGPQRDARADFADRGRALEQLDVETSLTQRDSSC